MMLLLLLLLLLGSNVSLLPAHSPSCCLTGMCHLLWLLLTVSW
jgi:hypothetical protein